MVRLVRSLLLLLGLATLSACAAYEQRAELSPQAPVPQAPVAAATGKITTTRTVVVNFDSNSDEIRAGAMQILYGAATDLRGAKLTSIRVTGHADGAGRRSYNQNLSERRAAAVAAQMGKLGLRADTVTTSGAGESTGAPRRSKDDRRVEIVFELVQEIADGAPLAASSAPTSIGAATPLAPALPIAAMAELPSPNISVASPYSPTPLRSADKHAIKRFLVLDGTAWLPPPAA